MKSGNLSFLISFIVRDGNTNKLGILFYYHKYKVQLCIHSYVITTCNLYTSCINIKTKEINLTPKMELYKEKDSKG